MLLVYSRRLDLGTGSLEALFGVYALGLIPGLLLAGLASDARGRRAVVVPAAGLSLAAAATLALGGNHVAPPGSTLPARVRKKSSMIELTSGESLLRTVQ